VGRLENVTFGRARQQDQIAALLTESGQHVEEESPA
jgi:hypothetical protein